LGVFQRINRRISPISLLLYWPAFFFYSGDIAKQLSLFLLLLLLSLKIRKSVVNKIDGGLIILSILLVYYFIINTLNFTSVTDYIDIIKCVGLIIVYLVAKSTDRVDISGISKSYGVVLIVLMVLFFLGGPLNISNYFYSDFGRRFFGTSNSPNYYWINIASLAVLMGGFKRQNGGIYFIYFLSLLLTGSRTTYLLISMLLFAYIITDPKRLILRLTIFTIVFLIIPWKSLIPHFYIKRFVDLYNALADFDIARLHSFSVRLEVWKEALAKFSWFGTGSRKTLMHVYDNTFFTSIIRYGYVGMFIELSFYIFIYFKSLKAKIATKFTLTLFLLSYFIAGITSSVFYNLRLPYMLIYILVLVATPYASIRNTGN
jgi:hypothetical protein